MDLPLSQKILELGVSAILVSNQSQYCLCYPTVKIFDLPYTNGPSSEHGLGLCYGCQEGGLERLYPYDY